MLILAVDTSAGLGVAVAQDGEALEVLTDSDPRSHAERLTPTIASACRGAGIDRRDLDAIAVGVGPAPFTGLRVGVVTAIVLGEVLGIPVHGVSSLDAVALTAARHVESLRGLVTSGAPFLVATDARRREVHWGVYTGVSVAAGADTTGLESIGRDVRCRDVRCIDGPHVGPPAQAAQATPGVPAVGSGATRYPDELPGPPGREAADAVDPAVLAALAHTRLADGTGLLPPRPLYLRRPDARELVPVDVAGRP